MINLINKNKMGIRNRLLEEIVKLGNKQKKVRLQKATKVKNNVAKLKKERKRLDKFVRNHAELSLINTALAESRKRITLDSGVKVEVVAGDKSIWIIQPDGEKIALPEGSYAYQEKLIIVEPEGTIKNITAKPKDLVTDKISQLRKYKI